MSPQFRDLIDKSVKLDDLLVMDVVAHLGNYRRGYHGPDGCFDSDIDDKVEVSRATIAVAQTRNGAP